MNIPSILLQLIIKKLGTEDELRIEIEFAKDEIEDFIAKLKKI